MFFFFKEDMTRAEQIYQMLLSDFGFIDANGSVKFNLRDFHITVEQNNIVGNILEEWLAKWLAAKGIEAEHNQGQASPDFWLNLQDKESDWLEVKSFTGSPNFDIAAFRSFINLIIDKPYKLHSDYLLIKYKMIDGIVTVENCWLKKVWEISSASARFPVKVQYRNKAIVNIRPAVWYSENTEFPVFTCLEDFISALEETIYQYQDTRYLTDNWKKNFIASYKKFYGIELNIPRWSDIKDKYIGNK